MKQNLKFHFLCSLLSVLSLSVFAGNYYKGTSSAPGDVEIEVSYSKGSANFSSSIVYVIWIENEPENYIQNLFVCNSVLGIGKTLTGTALPYWKMNKYPESEVDGVTGATQKNTDFTVARTLINTSIRQFTIYMEVDHSFDANDWFWDQPALLYSAEVDLDSPQAEYTLIPVGWTRNNNLGTGGSSNVFKDDPPHTSPPIGELQSELRYIKNKMNGTVFGDEYTDNTAATSLVGSLKAKITIAPDNTAPTVPTNLNGTAISSSIINLTWTASTDNVGVNGYRIYRVGNGAHVVNSDICSYSDSGLTEVTQYTYSVSAYDDAGNESEQSTAIDVTTLNVDLITSDESDEKGMEERLVKIYPNPSYGRFTVELSNFPNPVQVSIVDMVGSTIYPWRTINSTRWEIDLNTRAKGVYIVRLTDGENVITRKIIGK